MAHVKVRIQELGRGELLAEVSFDLPDVDEKSLTEKLRLLFSEFVFPEGEIGRQLRDRTNVVALRQHSPLTLVGVRKPQAVPPPIGHKGVVHKGDDEYQKFYHHACEALDDIRRRVGKDAFYLSETQISRDQYLKVFAELRKLPDGELRIAKEVSRALRNSEEGRSEPKQEEFVDIIRSIIAARESLRVDNERLRGDVAAAVKEKDRLEASWKMVRDDLEASEAEVRKLEGQLDLLEEQLRRNAKPENEASPPTPEKRSSPRYRF